MATARQTIQDAFELTRIVGVGRSPSSAQAAWGLRRLNAWLNQLPGNGGGLPLRDATIDTSVSFDDCWPCWPSMRLQCTAAVTITLPEGDARNPVPDGMIVDIVNPTGASITLARNGWLITGSASNATFTTSRRYRFRGDLGDWKLDADLGLDDSLPFPAEFDDACAYILALRLGGRFGQALTQEDRDIAKTGETRLRARYCAPPPTQFDAETAFIGVANRGGYPGSLSAFLNGNF